MPGAGARAEIVVIDGAVVDIRFAAVAGCLPLETSEMRYFREHVEAKASEIVSKWIDFFVLHKPVRPETITRRLK